MFQNDDWLRQVEEPVISPEIEIVDPHHHLWDGPAIHYDLSHLHADTSDGHNVVETVFMECGASYLEDGPEHLRPTGETIFVEKLAKASAAIPGQATISGMVLHADLRHPTLDETLSAHQDLSGGLFKGIRHAGAHDPEPEALRIQGRARAGLYRDDDFRAGVARLGSLGLTYDTWHFHHQNQDFYDLARAVPDTVIVLDHFGTPLGVGRFADKREEIFAQWKDDIAAIASCPNVVAKLGGLAMPDNGFGWDQRDTPPTSQEFVDAQARYYHHTIACFGPDRCMFESNFPVDRLSIGYRALWNGLKIIGAKYSADEQEQLFSGTARRIYRL